MGSQDELKMISWVVNKKKDNILLHKLSLFLTLFFFQLFSCEIRYSFASSGPKKF